MEYLLGARNRIAFILSAVPLLALACVPAVAQSSSRQRQETVGIEGVVRSPAGEPVADASVLLQGSDKKTFETKTDGGGKFIFPHCRFDIYSIHAAKSGFEDSPTVGLKIIEPGTSQIRLVLKPKAATKSGAPSSASSSSPGEMKFDDKPNFVIAGVKDWSDADLHGSAANARTSDSLNHSTLALQPSAGTTNSAGDSAGMREAEAHRVSAERFEKAGDPFAAEREYEAAVRLDPSEENYFAWGAELLLHKATQPAVEVFTRGISAHPKSWRMRAGLAAALFAGNSYDEAAQRLCEASDLSPETEAPHVFLGEIEKSTTAPLPCAEERLARFVGEQPKNAQANYYYAIALWKRARGSSPKNLKPAETLLEKAVALNPAFAEAQLQLGILHSDSGELEQAMAAYRRAIELKPGLAEAHHRLALAYKRLGDEPKAQQEFGAYEGAEKAEAAALEKQHQQLRQFLVVLRDHAADSSPH
jgi:tetratricopeptide (TPR) repeat protein